MLAGNKSRQIAWNFYTLFSEKRGVGAAGKLPRSHWASLVRWVAFTPGMKNSTGDGSDLHARALGGHPGGQDGNGKIRDCSSLLATPGAPTTLGTQVVVGCFLFAS